MKKVAIITGGAQGIGRAISLRLAKDGFNIGICDLESQKKKADEIRKEVENYNCKASFFPTDVTKKQQFESAIDKVHKDLGSFDVLVNNAGICIADPISNITEVDLEKHWAVNVKGTLFGMQAAAKKFKELGKNKGKIINAASVASQVGIPTMGAYCSTKFAVRGLTQTAAQEFAPLGINVNSYCPGPVDTALFEGIINKTVELGIANREESTKMHMGSLAMKRTATPRDIIGLVSFLASEDSDFITGQSIIVDGGQIYR